MARFEDTFERYRRPILTDEDAGELLGMSGRNFRRLCVRCEEGLAANPSLSFGWARHARVAIEEMKFPVFPDIPPAITALVNAVHG